MGATVVFALATHLALAALFALEYRFYYAHWHAPAFTLIWGIQFAITTLSAAYQFTVISFSIYGCRERRFSWASACGLAVPRIEAGGFICLDGPQPQAPQGKPPMIPRYSRPEMVAIWSPETKFRIWFEIEAHACTALAKIGVIPEESARTIWEKGSAAQFDVARIDEIEAVTSMTSSPS